MNIDSYTDEELLNIVNRTILEKTEYPIDKFSGGYISPTTAYKNKIIKYTVALFFGYKEDGKSSISKKFETTEDLYFIWAKALFIKTISVKINTIGSSTNEINHLAKPLSPKEEKELKKRAAIKDRTDTVRDTDDNLSSISEPTTSLSKESKEEIKKIVTLFDAERQNLQPNFIRIEFKNQDGEYLLEKHLEETGRTANMFFDALKWLFSNNPQAEFWRQHIMNIGKLIEHFNRLEHQAMYSKESIKYSEEINSIINLLKKDGLSDLEIENELRKGGYIK